MDIIFLSREAKLNITMVSILRIGQFTFRGKNHIAARSFIGGKVADKLDISVWEYADISKAIDAVKNFYGGWAKVHPPILIRRCNYE